MKAAQFSRFGGPEVLETVDLPTPEPQAGEVLIRVHAAGINFFEVLMRADRYAVTPQLPMVPGVEAAGVVEAVGQGADDTLIGTRIAAPLFASTRPFGGYAEYVTIDAGLAVPLPDPLSFEEATALMVQGLTAFHLLRQSPPANRTVLFRRRGRGRFAARPVGEAPRRVAGHWARRRQGQARRRHVAWCRHRHRSSFRRLGGRNQRRGAGWSRYDL